MSDRQDFYYETRFAVVMYGGISLAIYINGVAQELHRMVRATARKADGSYEIGDPKDLDHSEIVYREVGEKLGTKFVVDILSGTSAGGLNAIFLAKALANNQNFSLLADLWKNVADVNTLIYDRESVQGLPVRLEVPERPSYLMNSQRMTYLLYKAFCDMGPDLAKDETSKYAKELDLYVTATDLYGRNIKLYTSNPDTFPEEKRFRKVFHLRYSKEEDGQNDLTNSDNPFLAFISRCTSAIPPAFEPMTLNDSLTLPGVKVLSERKEHWKKYFEDIENDAHLDRPYGDGGYLDNKPFSYATESLLNRTSEYPVDRKLFYVEPSPQDLSLERTSGQKPNVIENVTKATVSLPMYEPIRDDLEAVHRRNKMIERSQETLRDVEKHLYKIAPENIRTISSGEWPKLGLKDCIERMDPSFGAYITLRVNALLDGITDDMAAIRNLDDQSTEFAQLHQSLWDVFNRTHTSEPEKESENGKVTWNHFLQDNDLDWRIRRLNFLHGKIDEMLVLVNILQSSLRPYGFAERKLSLNWKGPEEKADQAVSPKEATPDNLENHAAALLKQSIQKRINDLFYEVQRKKPREDSVNLYQWVKDTFNVMADADGKNPQLDGTRIDSLLKDSKFLSGFSEALKKIKSGLNGLQKNLYDARATIREQANLPVDDYLDLFIHQTDKATKDSWRDTKNQLGMFWDSFSSAGNDVPAQVALLYLQAPYDSYEYYDRLTYPLIVANDLGEADVVEVWRISPNDSMVFNAEKYKKKLGGQTLVNFGAFFKKEWRENDIMWGRLDGVEQVIRSLGMEKTEQDEYIQKAQAAILRNEVAQKNARLKQILEQDEEYKNVPAGNPIPDNVIMDAFKNEFSIDLSLEPRNTLQLTARSTQVAGKMFDGLSIDYSIKNNVFAKWITRAGQFLFWVTEMATTDSWLHIIARNIFMLLYFAGFFLVAAGSLSSVGGDGGPFSSISRLTTLGWGVIGFTAFLQYANTIVSQILSRDIPLAPKPEQDDKQKKKSKPIRFIPPFIQSISAGALLLLLAFSSGALINFLSATKEIFWLIGIILLFFGLAVYLVYVARKQIKTVFSNTKNDLWIYFLLIVVFGLSIFFMGQSFAQLADKGYTILNLEFANSAQKAVILQAWAGGEKYLWQTLSIDFVFLLSLSAFLWLVWNRYSKRIVDIQRQSNGANFCRIMSALAIMGGLFDIVENISIMGMLAGFSIEKLGLVALVATWLKFIAYTPPALLWLFFGLWLWGASSQKAAGST